MLTKPILFALPQSAQPFHVMANPSGPACNLDCEYCFYLEKKELFPKKTKFRMTDETLAAYIQNHIASTPEKMPVLFAWQGGEPMLLGQAFYEKALFLQKEYGQGRAIENSLQTNGVLMNEDWAHFLAAHRFLVGLSLDGPAFVHDEYRKDKRGGKSHAKVMNALALLQKHQIDFNAMVSVTDFASRHAWEIYDFFKAHGVSYLQFIPIVEQAKEVGGSTPWSVTGKAWGNFLKTIFDTWKIADIGKIFVMNFEWTLSAYMGGAAGTCVHQKNCGRALALEHNGDVYACDHYVDPSYFLGNLTQKGLSSLVDSEAAESFGQAKSNDLPPECLRCRYLHVCWGGCPKHRFLKSEDGTHRFNHLCEGYRDYFQHIEAECDALQTQKHLVSFQF